MLNDKKKRVIKTFDGTEALRSECRYISGQFYKMGVQCFKMPDDKWHRVNNGLIVFNYETKEWALKSGVNLYSGVVDVDKKGNFIKGNFTRNIIKNIELMDGDGNTYLGLSKDVLTSDFIEIISRGCYIHKKHLDLRSNTHTKKSIGTKYPFRLNYSFEHEYQNFKKYYDEYFEYRGDISKTFYRELGSTTFGVEYETYDGIIPLNFCYITGLIPLKDGSLRHDHVNPFEYTTIPLQGEKGLHTIKQNCEYLNKYCVRNTNGSVHIHIGNYNRTKAYGVAMYRLLFQIQDELYSMFPKYFNQTSVFKSTGKDYCQPLPAMNFTGNLEKDSARLFKYYINGKQNWSEDESYNFFGTTKPKFEMGMNHPNDSTFDHKWYTEMRYKHSNILPLFFNKRNTAEFRIHTNTFNSDKVINWLFVINSICKYAHVNQDIIAKKGTSISLEEIFESVYSRELSDYLKSYVRFRKKMMNDHFRLLGDGSGITEVKEDHLKGWSHHFKSLI